MKCTAAILVVVVLGTTNTWVGGESGKREPTPLQKKDTDSKDKLIKDLFKKLKEVEKTHAKETERLKTELGDKDKELKELEEKLKAAQKREQDLAAKKELINGIGMELVWIPPGKFLMGSPQGEKDRVGSEEPQKEVTITKGFYLGKYEVTQVEYRTVMGTNPSHHSSTGSAKGSVEGKDTRRFPVDWVSWEEANAYCRKLTEKERQAGKLGAKQAYRLPTDAEWEYACRGRAKTYQVFHYGNSLSLTQANFSGGGQGKPLSRPTTVGSYEANGFGLHDMHGNVAEWCAEKGVWRGGSWAEQSGHCRSAFRYRLAPDFRNTDLGFRVALSSVE